MLILVLKFLVLVSNHTPFKRVKINQDFRKTSVSFICVSTKLGYSIMYKAKIWQNCGSNQSKGLHQEHSLLKEKKKVMVVGVKQKLKRNTRKLRLGCIPDMEHSQVE